MQQNLLDQQLDQREDEHEEHAVPPVAHRHLRVRGHVRVPQAVRILARGARFQEAVAGGGTLLCGGGREGAMLEATLLEDVPVDEAVVCREAFGPVAILSRYADFDTALRTVNDSVFGLQAGIFTRDLYKAQKAWNELEVGGVVIGDVPSWRVDHMPYGGVKDSGLGREGIRFAMEDMTEVRLLVVRTPEGG